MSVPAVSVVVPWRAQGAYRPVVWQWVRRWWEERHPGWELIVGDGGTGPWRKGAAVAEGARRARGAVVVVADADVVCEGVDAATTAVTAGAPWAIPHRAVHRLSPLTTRAVLAGAPLPTAAHPRRELGRALTETHPGMPGGGIVVLPAATLAEVPMDPRFTGWGQEDQAWARALVWLAGAPWRGTAPLWHLWHPPAPRESRSTGSAAGRALWERYRRVSSHEQMRALLAEYAGGAGAG